MTSAYFFCYELAKVLSKKQKKNLLTLLADVMEKSYRRGVQQALVMDKKNLILPKIKKDLHAYRYRNSLRKIIGLDGYPDTAENRLQIEFSEVIAFKESEPDV
jgi:hypothetical protein